jgi:peptidoglycan/LPS O-acetylase OafA/YrhL
VLVGVLWALLAPFVVGHTDRTETQASGDTTLALLELLAGVVTAAALAWRPGRRPAARFAVALVGVAGAAFLSWAVGEAVGAPVLHAIGVVLIWPFVTAGLTVVRVVVDLVLHGEA